MYSCGNIARIADDITACLDLYRNHGDADYIGEEVSQLQHALQCAHQAKEQYPNYPEVILGAFFHDIGHLIALDDGKTIDMVFKNISMDGLGLEKHEQIGGDFLDIMGFPDTVGDLARNHILAKRYMITTDKSYYDNLSEASKQTFWKQGGYLDKDLCDAFLNDPNHQIYLECRLWDDMAKVKNFEYKFGIDYIETLAREAVFSRYKKMNDRIATR